ncbi:MAG: beta-mannosidase, partial [Segetibacter sp.]|nr:beta-mannosidase [Segetibacter sp.]
AFNTDRFGSKEEYLKKYPGDEPTDVVGFDIYQRQKGDAANEQFVKDADKMLTTLEEIAMEKNKIPALTEFGFGQVPDSTWWMNVLWKAIQKHKISYALAWRNAGAKPSGENEYYLPYKEQVSEKNFLKFYQLPRTLFQKDVTNQKIYK